MNAQNQEPHLALPEPLVRQLGQFRQRLLSVETMMAAAGGIAGLLATYLLLFLSDRLWDTPMWARLAFTVTGTATAAWCGWYWAQRWVMRRRNNRDLALLVQQHFPRLGDRLLGTVELAEDETLPPDTSPALCRAAMRQVAEEASRMDFTRAVPSRRPRQLAVVMGVLAVVAATTWLLMPSAGRNALARWIKPWSNVDRYTFTRLSGLPDKLVVPYGENFHLKAQLDPSSEWRPDFAAARVGRQPAVQANRQNDAFPFEIPGQTKPDKLAVSAGDAREMVAIEPVHRPDLTALNVEVSLPDYLQYPRQTVDGRQGSVDALAGSDLTFHGRVSRELEQVTLTAGDTRKARVDGREFVSDQVHVSTNLTVVSFGWRDVLGLDAPSAFDLKVGLRTDEKPYVECRNLARVTVILENELLNLDVFAEDDYGVKDVGIAWIGESQDGQPPLSATTTLEQGKQQDRQLSAATAFSPVALGLRPQKVTMRAQARDFLPGRAPSESVDYTIHIMSLTEHAASIERKLDAIQSKLESLTRTEENLWDENKTLQMQDDKGIESKETEAKLGEQANAEKANAQAMDQLQQEMKDLLKDAMRNAEIPPEAMKSWAEMTQAMQQIAQQDMPQASQSMQQAQQNQNADQRREQMQQSTTKQNEILEKLKEMQRKMEESGQQLQAANFINRLKQASEAETKIGAGLVRMLPTIIGLTPSQLSPALKTQMNSVRSDHADNQQSVRDIRDDLGHYLKRVTKPGFVEVHKAMKESNVVESLDEVTGMIAENRSSVAATETEEWAAKLGEWAKMLEPDGSGSGSGQGNGQPQEMTPEQMELLMKLMQIRQQEEGLREHTRYLEKHKDKDPRYSDNAKRLARLQQGLEKDLKAVANQISGPPKIVKMLDQAMAAMADATELLDRPDTGGRTIAAETEVIELLSESINQGSGSGSSSSSAAMGMMMGMMGMTPSNGPTPGGNPTGGNTTKSTDPIQGTGKGGTPGERTVTKAGGRSSSAFPAEFRDALEGFYNTMESDKE